MTSALLRYRVIAYVVGVALLVLVLIGMPLKYLADQPSVVATVGPVHGFLYMAYLVLAFDLSRRARWSLGTTGLVLLAGTVPFLSFVVERKITNWLRNPERGPTMKYSRPTSEPHSSANIS